MRQFHGIQFHHRLPRGKVSKYIINCLNDISVPQQNATHMYDDNNAAENMANNRKPVGRSRHIDIQYYVLQEWVQRGIFILKWVYTNYNIADTLTRILVKILNYRHNDELVGYNGPKYWKR